MLLEGKISPVGATVDYQWQISNVYIIGDSSYIDIPGATSNTYTPVATDVGKYLKLIIRGTGNYSGIHSHYFGKQVQ